MGQPLGGVGEAVLREGMGKIILIRFLLKEANDELLRMLRWYNLFSSGIAGCRCHFCSKLFVFILLCGAVILGRPTTESDNIVFEIVLQSCLKLSWR